MVVQLSGYHIRNAVTPVNFLFKRDKDILHAFEYWPQVVSGVLKKTEQKFQRAVSRPPAEPVHGRINAACAPYQCLDGISEGELLVIMGVYADFLPASFQYF